MATTKPRDFRERLEHVTAETQFDQADFARVMSTNPRTISRWLGGTTPRPETRERLLEVLAVLEALSEVLRPSAAHDWLFSPNPLLDHHKPVDLLHEGEYRRVLGAIDVMADGVFV